jgi:hypothetical protein
VFDSGIARLTSGRNTTVFHDITGFFSALKRQDFIGPPPLPRNNGPNESAAFWIGRGRWESLGILKGCTQDSDYLFSGLRNHDRVFINDNVIYYLAGRRPVTKWSHFDPSLQTQRPIQEEIVRDLELNKPPFLWIDALWQNIGEPNNASISSGVKILDDYISSKYEIFSIRDNVGLLSRVGIKLTENCMRARGSI